MQKTILHTALICLFAFLGGFVSEQLFHPHDSYAQTTAEVKADMGSMLANSKQILFDSSGHKRIDIDASSRSPVQDFYGPDGSLRLQLGMYPGAEKQTPDGGLPLIGLSDLKGRLRLLLRIAQGSNQAPVLVMKDSKGKDRIVMGTSLNGEDEEPFLATFDKYGARHMVFGNF